MHLQTGRSRFIKGMDWGPEKRSLQRDSRGPSIKRGTSKKMVGDPQLNEGPKKHSRNIKGRMANVELVARFLRYGPTRTLDNPKQSKAKSEGKGFFVFLLYAYYILGAPYFEVASLVL